jgi:hypothetical protein
MCYGHILKAYSGYAGGLGNLYTQYGGAGVNSRAFFSSGAFAPAMDRRH